MHNPDHPVEASFGEPYVDLREAEARGLVWVVGTWNGLGCQVGAFFQSCGAPVFYAPCPDDDAASLCAFGKALSGVSLILYCGAVFDPDYREAQPGDLRRRMIELPLSLGALAADKHARFIVIFPAQVFSGQLKSRGYSETYRTNPVNDLGRIQLEAEAMLRAVCPDAFIIRTSWLFGDLPNSFESFWLCAAINRSLETGKQVTVPDAKAEIVSPTYTKNLARALFDVAILDSYPSTRLFPLAPWLPPRPGGIYHYADFGEASLAEFARAWYALAKKQNPTLKVVRVIERPASSFPNRVPRPPRLVLAAQRLAKNFTVIRRQPWQDALYAYGMAHLPVPQPVKQDCTKMRR
jgi:dTDP-4-dehydrorhamnose reductase